MNELHFRLMDCTIVAAKIFSASAWRDISRIICLEFFALATKIPDSVNMNSCLSHGAL